MGTKCGVRLLDNNVFEIMLTQIQRREDVHPVYHNNIICTIRVNGAQQLQPQVLSGRGIVSV